MHPAAKHDQINRTGRFVTIRRNVRHTGGHDDRCLAQEIVFETGDAQSPAMGLLVHWTRVGAQIADVTGGPVVRTYWARGLTTQCSGAWSWTSEWYRRNSDSVRAVTYMGCRAYDDPWLVVVNLDEVPADLAAGLVALSDRWPAHGQEECNRAAEALTLISDYSTRINSFAKA